MPEVNKYYMNDNHLIVKVTSILGNRIECVVCNERLEEIIDDHRSYKKYVWDREHFVPYITNQAEDAKSNEYTFRYDEFGKLTILKDGVPIQEFDLRGPEGKPGKDGAPGQNGAKGQDGKDGTQGRPGTNGMPGKDGKDGIDGAPGNDGKDGATFIPHITKEGELFFTSNKSSDRISVGNVKGTDGKTFYPHIDGTELYFTEDEEGKGPELFRIDLKGETGNDGRTYVPKIEGTKLHFDDLAGHTTSEVDLRGKDAFELWKEYHHKPNATYEEFEEYFKGQNIKSEYSYLDIKDAEIPVQRINRTLISDSDLTDGMSIEEFYEYRKNRIKQKRAEGAKKTDNWFKEFFWWCAGADAPLLRMCPADHSKYVGIGTVIFFTALMAFFSCFTAMQLVFGGLGNDANIGLFAAIPLGIMAIVFICRGIRLNREEKKPGLSYFLGALAIGSIVAIFLCTDNDLNRTNIVAAIIALIWAAMIFFLDRFITNTMYSDGKTTISWLEFRSGLPRIVISIFLGIVISAPLELRIFKNEISNALLLDISSKKNEYISSCTNKDKQMQSIAVYDNLQNQSINKKNTQIDKYNTRITRLIEKAPQISDYDDRYDETTGKLTWSKKAQYDHYYQKWLNSGEGKQYLHFSNEVAKLQHEIDSISNLIDVHNQGVLDKILTDESTATNAFDAKHSKDGLFLELEMMHKMAMRDKDGNDYIVPALCKDSKVRWGGVGGVLILLVLIGVGIYRKKFSRNDLNPDEESDKKAFWFKYIPLMIIASLILGLGLGTWHQLLTFLLTPVGLIMLLFILIDVSPVFYKMMLADGEYDKMHYQDKMIEQDFIRLQVAKAMYKVNESELSKFSPFIFGTTFSKAEELIKRYHLNQGQNKALDLDISGQNNEISKKNSQLLSEVLDMKYRIAYAAYAAWYRDMRDYILGKKDDAEGATIRPENTIEDDIPNDGTSNNQGEEFGGEQLSAENLDDETM